VRPVVVLVEGQSDALAVQQLAQRRGLDVEVVAVRGVTNARRYAATRAGSATRSEERRGGNESDRAYGWRSEF
jgi:hypothetical protein